MTTGDLDQTRLALAALTACIARTLGVLDGDFPRVFERHLEEAYAQLREMPGGNAGALETLAWTRDLVKKL
jgi:hypothetical protein